MMLAVWAAVRSLADHPDALPGAIATGLMGAATATAAVWIRNELRRAIRTWRTDHRHRRRNRDRPDGP